MLVILQNNKIVGVDKELLENLGIELEELSAFINTLSLQLASLQNEHIDISNRPYKVKHIPMLSTTQIEVFDISPAESYAEESIKEEPALGFEIKEPEKPAEPEIGDISIIEPEKEKTEETEEKIDISLPETPIQSSLPEEDITLNNIIPETEPEIKPLAEPEIQTFETSATPQEETTPIQTLDNIIPPVEEEPQKASQEPVPQPTEIHEEKPIDESIKEELEKALESPSELLEEEQEEIEISFEDDLDEIIQILNLPPKEFNETIVEELNKASEELGIPYEDLEEWYYQLLDQIKDEKKPIYKYIQNSDYTSLHESYHKLKGAALNLRLSKIALILKKLDELSKNNERIEKIKKITDDFYTIIENEIEYLSSEAHASENSKEEDADQSEEVKEIEDIIIETIKNYLTTQNEEQFQKDKKYIEKLLNKKIDSIEDLQNLIKGLE